MKETATVPKQQIEDTTMTTYISDYTAPLRLTNRIINLVDEKDLNSVVSCAKGDPLTSAIHVLLESAQLRCESYDELDDEHFLYVGKHDVPNTIPQDEKGNVIAIPVGDMVCIVRRTSQLPDVTRSVDSDELTRVDMALALASLSKSYLDGFLLLRYDEITMWTNPLIREFGDMFGIYGGLTSECRSVVLDVHDLHDIRIASLPYHKFRNMNEVDGYMESQIRTRIAEAEHVEFTDKLDGSMIQMRYLPDAADVFEDGLLVTSSGSLSPKTSNHVVLARRYVAEHSGERFLDMCREYPESTFIFEYVNPPEDSHVVAYPQEAWGMYLTGIRDVATGRLHYHDDVEHLSHEYGIRCSKFFIGYKIDDALHDCANDSPCDREGFVLNVDGFLVKMKLESFLGIARIVHSVASFNTISRNVALGLMDDLIAKVPPEHRAAAEETWSELRTYDEDVRACIEATVERLDGLDMRSRAEVINSAVPSQFRGYVFEVAAGKGYRGTYLGERIGTDSPHFFNRSEFERRSKAINEWMSDLGI